MTACKVCLTVVVLLAILVLPVGFHPVVARGAPPQGLPTATLHTSAGDIVLRLRTDVAPQTVACFVEDARRGVYNATMLIHDVGPFPAYGGAFLPDGQYQRADVVTRGARENDNGPTNGRGCIGVRPYHAGPEEGAVDSHELYVCYEAYPSADGYCTVFGELLTGMDIVDAIVASAGGDGPPGLVVTVVGVEVAEN